MGELDALPVRSGVRIWLRHTTPFYAGCRGRGGRGLEGCRLLELDKVRRSPWVTIWLSFCKTQNAKSTGRNKIK